MADSEPDLVDRVPSRRRRSIRDVAALAGVSVGTVSNVLNKPDLVATTTRSRVEEAIAELGFIRSGAARQLRAGVSRTVGAVVLDMANPFFTDVARGVEDRLAADDCMLVLASSDDRAAKERRYVQLLEEQGVQGVLLTPADDDLGWLGEVRERGTAIVLVDRPSPTSDMCSVAVDDVRGAELAGAHLLANGHERMAFVNGSVKIRQCADRRRGMHTAIQRAGRRRSDILTEVTVNSLNADGGEQALEELLSGSQPITAIACVNDLTALGVLRGLLRRRIRVPEDIAVVGYDDVEFAAVLATPLTSIRQPRYQLGRTAADLLLAEAGAGTGTGTSGEHEHQQILFQPELVVRESSQPS